MSQHEVLAQIAAAGVVPTVELGRADQSVPLLEALLAGGIAVIEITLRTTAGLEAIELLRARYPEALVGAGTVRTRGDAIRSFDAGAQFVVSPGTTADVLETCAEHGVPAIPGACTPTEIESAVAGGAAAVKLFPIEASGGLALVRALAGPFRGVSFVPTGGVDATNLDAYLRAPGVVACGGTWLVARALVEEGRFDRVEELTRQAASIVAATRTETILA